ncbi:MAG: NAD(P)H-dependent oxidoreductase [Capsulimonadaceae bacterium]|nr:NAD(P)H-dependent oxidoreductase [Capsulimonadaceae bacterium]
MSKDSVKKLIREAYRFRHACKRFDERNRVPDEDFNFILEAGRLSPSSYGFEPWKFLVVENQAIREKMKPIVWGAANRLEASTRVVVLLARRKVDLMPDSPYIEHVLNNVQQLPEEIKTTKRGVYQRFLDEEFALLGDDRYVFDWACRQAYIPLANMLTTAAMLGIDSCPVEGFHLANLEALLASEGVLDIEHFGVASLVFFGYRTKEPREKTRRCFAEVVQTV